jgi:5'-nucleotidase
MVEVAGVKVGIIGVMTEWALSVSIAANTVGLRVAPLTETIIREARALREKGAALVIVTAHAGSFCEQFDDPLDLSSCNLDGEIMRVASELPPGLVDHINAGHVHRGIAHIVNGVSITSSFASTRAFSRVDFTIDPGTGETRHRQIFPPEPSCSFIHTDTGECASPDDALDTIIVKRYEGVPILPNTEVLAIAERTEAIVREKKAEELGIYLDTAITLEGRPESALGNLLTDAVLQSIDADIYLHNVVGGIRANLPAGELTFGKVFNIMPFDNRVVVLDISGAQLRHVMEVQAHKSGSRAGFSGMRVYVDCDSDQMSVRMNLANGQDIEDGDRLKVAVSDFVALGGDEILMPIMPADGFEYSTDLPMIRDVLVDWFTKVGQQDGTRQVVDLETPRWMLPDSLPAECSL